MAVSYPGYSSFLNHKVIKHKNQYRKLGKYLTANTTQPVDFYLRITIFLVML